MAIFIVVLLLLIAPHPQPLLATTAGRALQQIRSGFVPNQLNEWLSVRVTQGEDPHAYGINLQMWRTDTTIAGFLSEYTGSVADPRMGRLDSIKFDQRNGTVAFTATTRRPAILDGSPSVVLLILVYEFSGVIDDSTMRGTLRRREIAPPSPTREENIILRRTTPSMNTQPAASFQSWLQEREAVVKFQSGGNYATPPLQPAPGVRAAAETFTLEASHGQTVEHEFGSDLIFRLAANRDPVTPGWTIEVRPKGETDPEVELSWPVNPPYRSWTPRALDVSYGYTAAQALQVKTREFFFIRDPADYSRTAEAVRSLLWSYGIPQEQLDESRRIIDEVSKCAGAVRIVDGRRGKHAVTPLAPAERIEWLKVEVELCKPVPAGSAP